MKPGLIILMAILSSGCEYEKRTVGSDRPLSPPTGAADPRIQFYDKNAWQMSNGGRLFTWYGCGSCHAVHTKGLMNLRGGRPVAFETVYGAVANGGHGMPAYGDRMTSESIWQLAAYVRSLRTLKDTKRNRSDLDQKGEPTGRAWSGPVR